MLAWSGVDQRQTPRPTLSTLNSQLFCGARINTVEAKAVESTHRDIDYCIYRLIDARVVERPVCRRMRKPQGIRVQSHVTYPQPEIQ